MTKKILAVVFEATKDVHNIIRNKTPESVLRSLKEITCRKFKTCYVRK